MTANTARNHKDTLFSSLFYDCKDAVQNAKDLYKALTGKTVQNAEKCRLEDVLFREFKNDVAYIMDGRFICFIEHQSTINPNMPLRCLIYAARTYERKTIPDEKLMYSSKLITIPTPEFYVLYNGTDELKDKQLKLSDAFRDKTESPNMELKIDVVDINCGHLKDTNLQNCKPLYEYSYLIEKIREYKGDVPKAVNECIKQDILAEYLTFYGSEVVNMLYTEYDSELAMQVRSQEEYEKGIAEGRAEGRAEGEARGKSNMLKKLQKLGNTVKQLAEMFEMSESEVEKLLSMD